MSSVNSRTWSEVWSIERGDETRKTGARLSINGEGLGELFFTKDTGKRNYLDSVEVPFQSGENHRPGWAPRGSNSPG